MGGAARHDVMRRVVRRAMMRCVEGRPIGHVEDFVTKRGVPVRQTEDHVVVFAVEVEVVERRTWPWVLYGESVRVSGQALV